MHDTPVALVTGGSRGIGRAAALALAARGHALAITYKTGQVAAEQAAHEARAHGVECLTIRLDLERPGDVTAAVDRVRDVYGRLDVLVANAAATALKPILALKPHNISRTMTVTIESFVQLVQEVRPLMAGRPGTIVAVSGIDAFTPTSNHGLLGSAKAALEALVRSLAVELAADDIVVNAVAPGPVDTQSARHYAGDSWEQMSANWTLRTPAGRLGSPEDIGGIIGLLATDDARWLRGQVLVADGGLTLVSEPVSWF